MSPRYFARPIWLAALAVLLGASLELAAAQPAREVARRVLPSVVLLVIEDDSGHPLRMGSGFVVRDKVVATNMHVVKGASRGYASVPGNKTRYQIVGTLARDSTRDLLLLSVKDIKAPPLKIGDSSKAVVGSDVYAAGNPQGLEGTFSSGIVSGVRRVGEHHLLQITAPISAGSSGGPVVNNEGEVIGVAVATLDGGQNLNFAIPSAYLLPLISAPPDLAPLGAAAAPKQDFAQQDGSIRIDGKSVKLPHFDLSRPSSQTQPYSAEEAEKEKERYFRRIGKYYWFPDSVWRDPQTWETTLPALQVGEFGKIFKCRVVQIRGPEDMVVAIGQNDIGRLLLIGDRAWNRATLVRLYGFSTDGITDMNNIVLDDAIAIVATWTDGTADGPRLPDPVTARYGRTILMAVPLKWLTEGPAAKLRARPIRD